MNGSATNSAAARPPGAAPGRTPRARADAARRSAADAARRRRRARDDRGRQTSDAFPDAAPAADAPTNAAKHDERAGATSKPLEIAHLPRGRAQRRSRESDHRPSPVASDASRRHADHHADATVAATDAAP
jgi:hypothetical protein